MCTYYIQNNNWRYYNPVPSAIAVIITIIDYVLMQKFEVFTALFLFKQNICNRTKHQAEEWNYQNNWLFLSEAEPSLVFTESGR